MEYEEQEFLEKYGSPESVTIYYVPDHGELTLEQINQQFGGVHKLPKSSYTIQKPVLEEKNAIDHHGHFVVKHDLFNHNKYIFGTDDFDREIPTIEGETTDGISVFSQLHRFLEKIFI